MGLLRRRRSASETGDPGRLPVAPAAFGAIPSDAPPPVTDPDEQLRRLSDLRDRGLLSEREFAEQRMRVLGR